MANTCIYVQCTMYMCIQFTSIHPPPGEHHHKTVQQRSSACVRELLWIPLETQRGPCTLTWCCSCESICGCITYAEPGRDIRSALAKWALLAAVLDDRSADTCKAFTHMYMYFPSLYICTCTCLSTWNLYMYMYNDNAWPHLLHNIHPY